MGKSYNNLIFVDEQMRVDKRLIDEIKRYPELFNRNHIYFSDNIRRKESWLIIAKKLHQEPANIQRRFEELKQKYKVEKGNRSPNIPKQWPLFQYMEYFDESRTETKTEDFLKHVQRFLKKLLEIELNYL